MAGYDEEHQKSFHNHCGGELIKAETAPPAKQFIYTCSKCGAQGNIDLRKGKPFSIEFGGYLLGIHELITPEESEEIYQENLGPSMDKQN